MQGENATYVVGFGFFLLRNVSLSLCLFTFFFQADENDATALQDCMTREEYKLVTKQEAQKRFPLSDRDLMDLAFLPRSNPHGGKHPMRLYLESQVVALAERREKEREEDKNAQMHGHAVVASQANVIAKQKKKRVRCDGDGNDTRSTATAKRNVKNSKSVPASVVAGASGRIDSD